MIRWKRMGHLGILASIMFALPVFLFATDYSGSTFIIRDPVISGGGNRETSSSFELFSSVAQHAAGISTSNNFELRSGLLYFSAEEEAAAGAGAAPVVQAQNGMLFQLGLFFQLPLEERLRRGPPIALPPPEALVPCPSPADLNCDGKIDLQDLSIFLFVDPRRDFLRVDFNRDETLDAKDLSILLSDWSEPFLTFEKNPLYTPLQGGMMRQQEAISRDMLAEQFAFVGLISSDANTTQKQQEPLAQGESLYTQTKQSAKMLWSFTKNAAIYVYAFIRNLWHTVIY